MIIRKNVKRSALHAKLKHQKKVEKRKKLNVGDAVEKRALGLVEEPPPKMIPRTIENTREAEETVCKPNDEEEKLVTKYTSKGMEEGFDPTQVRATSGVKKRQLKGLDIHTHSEDVGVSTSRQCPSRPPNLQQSLQVRVQSLLVQVQSLQAQTQTWREELRKWQEQQTAMSHSNQKLQKSLQFLYTHLGMTPPPKMIPRTIENMREVDETVCKPNDVEEKLATNSLQVLVQTSREEQCKSRELYTALSQSYQKMQKSLQFLYTQLGMTLPATSGTTSTTPRMPHL
ncbi:hypothetical protein SLE2022_030840 [Rubroshorea leprosula]